MKTKIIATIVALVMVAMAFAALPTVSAQASHLWVTSSDGGTTGNIANAADATTPTDALGRHYIQTRPGEVIQGATAPNPPTSHDRVGVSGTSGMPNMAQIDSEGFTTPSVNGDPTIFIAERDTTAALTALFPVSVQISSMAGGNIPNGYVASAPVYSFNWAEPLGYGCFLGSTMTKIPSPVTPEFGPITWTAIAGVPNIYGYGVLESATSSGPWTEIGQSTGTSLAYAPINHNWYSLVIYWAGTGAGFLNTQAVRGVAYGAPTEASFLPESTYPPEASALSATPNPHNGNIASELVTITATITESAQDTTPDQITGARFRVDGGSWQAMTGAFPGAGPIAASGTFNFPNGPFAEGPHTFQVEGQDAGDGWNETAPIAQGTFTITDTTAPVVAWNAQPGTTAPYNAALNFAAGYGDFTDYNPAVAASYFQYRVNNGSWNNVVWNVQSFNWGSYLYTLTYSIPGGTFAIGDWVEYDGQIRDTAATPNTGLLSNGFVQILDAPPAVQDPYPIYGYVHLYNGDALGNYAPIISGAGTVVTANWVSSLTGLPISRTDTTNALGQFSIDCLNYTDATPVWLTATFAAPYGNNGYNYTTFDIAGFPGGRQQNVICGVPYDVIYNPVPPATVIAGAAYPVTYQIVDRDNMLCQGYYTFADGPMNFWTFDPLFVNDANHPLTFDGDGGAVTDGTYTGSVQFFTGGLQFLNITEAGAAGVNPYLTPWGNVQTMVAGVLVNIWLDDWANTTVQVISGAFIWHLVVGWNQVCVPMDPVDDGGDLVFGAFDALREVNADTTDAACAIAHRTGGNPSNYQVFDYGLLETDGLNFAMNYVEGYWIYATIAGDVSIQAINVSAPGVDNVITLSVGWNLLGFTHNYMVGGAQAGGWNAVLNADDFVSGAVDADLDTAGSNVKIVATWWVQGTQWYNSYVETDTFPGMAGSVHDWTYDTTYAYGYFIWSDEADTITFLLTY